MRYAKVPSSMHSRSIPHRRQKDAGPGRNQGPDRRWRHLQTRDWATWTEMVGYCRKRKTFRSFNCLFAQKRLVWTLRGGTSSFLRTLSSLTSFLHLLLHHTHSHTIIPACSSKARRRSRLSAADPRVSVSRQHGARTEASLWLRARKGASRSGTCGVGSR